MRHGRLQGRIEKHRVVDDVEDRVSRGLSNQGRTLGDSRQTRELVTQPDHDALCRGTKPKRLDESEIPKHSMRSCLCIGVVMVLPGHQLQSILREALVYMSQLLKGQRRVCRLSLVQSSPL